MFRAAITLILASVLSPLVAAGAQAGRAQRLFGCDRFVAPGGSDRGHGSFRRPFRTLSRLDRALRPGQTGCLRAGLYGGTSVLHRVYANARATGRITITSFPGETATIRGYVDIEGSYTTLSYMRIDGSNSLYRSARPANPSCRSGVSQPLVIAGPGDILEHDDYYQSVPRLRGNGIGIGFWGNANDTVIRFNRIHDVGQCGAEDHLIYLSHGNNVQIYDNWLWNDPHGRGVQLYPGPTNARIFSNVIDRAGEGFVVGNERGATVSGNEIFHNIISNSLGLPWERIPPDAIHDLYGGSPGRGNTFHNNDAYNLAGGIGHLTAVRSYRNMKADPHFTDAPRHNYNLKATGPFWQVWSAG
jgi:Right handed beta helix region